MLGNRARAAREGEPENKAAAGGLLLIVVSRLTMHISCKPRVKTYAPYRTAEVHRSPGPARVYRLHLRVRQQLATCLAGVVLAAA